MRIFFASVAAASTLLSTSFAIGDEPAVPEKASHYSLRFQMVEVNATAMRKCGMDIDLAETTISSPANRKTVSSIAPQETPAADAEKQKEHRIVALPALPPGTVITLTQKPDNSGPRPVPSGGAAGNDALADFFELLQRHNLSKVVSDSTVIVKEGSPAQCHSGGEIKIPSGRKDGAVVFENRKFGTEIDTVASKLSDSEVSVAFRMTQTELDYSNAMVVDGEKYPSFRTRRVDSNVQMPLDKKSVTGGMKQLRQEETANPVAGQPNITTDVEIRTYFIVSAKRADIR